MTLCILFFRLYLLQIGTCQYNNKQNSFNSIINEKRKKKTKKNITHFQEHFQNLNYISDSKNDVKQSDGKGLIF